MSAPDGCEIYYTVDGSTPSRNSSKYVTPIKIHDRKNDPNIYRGKKNVIALWNEPENIAKTSFENVDKCNIIKAIAVKDGAEPSNVVTKTFFVNMNDYRNDPVISIVADPDELFGDNGIYVTGIDYDEWYLGGQKGEQPKPNFSQRWEIESHIDYFDGEIHSDQNAGLMLQGASSRTFINKRFSIFARKEYSGSDYLDYYYFGYPNHSIFLRYDDTDLIQNELVDSIDTSVGTLGGYRTAVFLEGEFWYWSFLRPKYSRQNISWQYGVDKDSVIISERMPQEIYDFIEDNPSLKFSKAYEGLSSIVDIDNYIDFIASNVYLCNMDLNETKNLKVWKSGIISSSKFEDGKWRFLVYDMDAITWARVADKEISHRYEIDSFSEQRLTAGQSSYDEDRVFSALKVNDVFCEKFVTRFLDLANTYYSADEALKILDKFGYDESWNDDFFVYRFEYMAPALAKSFNLKGRLVEIGLCMADTSMGKIKVNTVEPNLKDGKWNGSYYTDYPLKLCATPSDGYDFVYWKNKDTGEMISESNNLTIDWNNSEYSDLSSLTLEPVFSEVDN